MDSYETGSVRIAIITRVLLIRPDCSHSETSGTSASRPDATTGSQVAAAVRDQIRITRIHTSTSHHAYQCSDSAKEWIKTGRSQDMHTVLERMQKDKARPIKQHC